MAQFRIKPRVRETSLITGSGTYTLLGAVTGFQAFLGGGVSAGDLVPYYATDGTNWEEGIGTVGSGPATLARTHIHKSSIADAAIAWGANTTVEIRIGWVSQLTAPRVKTVSIAGGAGTQILTQEEQRCDILILNGALTGNRNIEVDATPWKWAAVQNDTSGAFTTTLRVTGQTGVTIDQGYRRAVHCDGTDVRYSTTAVAPAPFIGLKKGIHGWTMANNGSDATNDLDIAAGGGMDSTNSRWLAGAALTKRTDAAWAVGTNQGMLDTGVIGNADYYVYAINRPDSDVTDYICSLAAPSVGPAMPANYTTFRYINWFKRSGGTIVPFGQHELAGGGYFHKWITPTRDIDLAATLTTSRRTDAVKVPLNHSVEALIQFGFVDAAALWAVWAGDPDTADVAPSTGITPESTTLFTGNVGTMTRPMYVRTSSAGLIGARADTATIDTYRAATLGFRNERVD